MDTITKLVARGIRLLEKFDPKCIDFLNWLNCFEYVVDYLEVTEDIETEFLLNMVEHSVFETLVSVSAPEDPFQYSYEKLISMLEQLYSSLQGELAAEYRFKTRIQMIDETVNHYAFALNTIINKCSPDFNTSDNLLNRFINGLIIPEIRSRLLQEPNLTFYTAVIITQDIEFDCFETRFTNLYISEKRR